MAGDFPLALIRSIQDGLREEAGIPSYNPNDLAVHTLPTMEQIIVGFDPSPLSLRCQNCRGKLLRGLQSLTCVYCGAYQKRENPPSFSFKSTFTCRKFLESLGLNGSEVVSVHTDERSGIRNKNQPRDKKVVSDLLDFKLTSPDEPELTQRPRENPVNIPTGKTLDLSGVDLDNFFSESKKDMVFNVSEDDFAPRSHSNIPGSLISTEQETSNLFGGFQFSMEPKTEKSDTSGFDDTFSSWDAEFQSASSSTFPVDPSINSEVDTTHPIVLVTSSGSDFGMEVNVQSRLDKEEQNNEAIVEDDDSDNWQDFTSSGEVLGPVSSSWVDGYDDITHSYDLNKGSSEGNLLDLSRGLEEIQFGDFSQQGTLLKAECHTNNSSLHNVPLETLVLDSWDGTKDQGTKNIQSHQDQPQSNANAKPSTHLKPSNSTVEMLMSEIPDLSFMLDSQLSIPNHV